MSHDLPVLGAALSLDMLARHRDWVLGAQRDLELQSFCWPNTPEQDFPEMIARAKTLLDGHTGRRGLHGPFQSFSIDCADPEIAAVIQRRMIRTLEICEELGADQMVIHSPYGIWNGADDAVKPSAAIMRIERVRFVLSPVIKRAEAAGVTLVLENCEDQDAGARVALARALKSPNVKVSLDTGHAYFMHRIGKAPPVDAFVYAADAMLEHVHLQDMDGQADRHWHPGEGEIHWHAVFKALRSLPKMPRLILEVNDELAVTKGAEWLAAQGLAR